MGTPATKPNAPAGIPDGEAVAPPEVDPVRVLVAAEHPVLGVGITAVLERTPGLRPVGVTADGLEVVDEARRSRPHVVILDVRLDGLAGLAVVERLREAAPHARCLILTEIADNAIVLRAFEAGARGYLLMESDASRLCAAVRIVAAGEAFLDPCIAASVVLHTLKGGPAPRPYGLTLRETRVIELVPTGLGNEEIATELGLSADAVRTHLRNAMRKLGVANRVETADLVVREGLAGPPLARRRS